MRRTPLHDEHVALGARMVDFAGWAMPVQYPTGIQQEHLAVRHDAGMFDVSHMGQLRVRGKDAIPFLSWATLNDPALLKDGRGQYTLLPNDRGGLIDDLYLYREGADDFLVVANASNVAAVRRHLEHLVAEGAPGEAGAAGGAGAFDVLVRDESDDWALIAVQGPTAAVRLGRVVEADLTAVRKNRFVDTRLSGMPVRLARTGYTGEDGFEAFVRPGDAPSVWQVLLEAGVVPCGLAARDTLRLEAGFPLFGHELTAETNPRCTPFAWVVKDKPAYGLDAILAGTCARRLVGIVLDGRPIPREGYHVLDADGHRIGTVTSGTLSPLTRRSIALAWVDAAFAAEGTRLAVEVRGQPAPGTVTAPPFHTP
jgi:aminomethyltransferase